MKKDTLRPKQRRFVEEYLIDRNGTQAAIRAGYAKNSANEQASQLLAKLNIREAVDEATEEISKSTKIDAEFIRTRLAEMINADPCDIINEETGAYKRIHDWPIEWRRMLSAADVRELFEANAQGKQEKIGEIVKFKFIDKLKAYELLGKHVGVNAFSDKLKIEGTIGINIDDQDDKL